MTVAAGRYRGPLGRPVFGKITPDYGYLLNYSFPRICNEKAMPVQPLRTPQCQVYASECYFPFPSGNRPLELYECEGHQAVPKPTYGFGWEPAFMQSRNFPLVEAKVRLIHHHQVRHPSVAGEDTPDSRSASSEEPRIPEDIPEAYTGTEQGIPDEARRYLHTSRPRQTPARPRIIPRRQRIGNWKKEFHNMGKEQIRKTEKLAKYEGSPYNWGPVFTESEEDESDPEPQIPERHSTTKEVCVPSRPRVRDTPIPQACHEPSTAPRTVSTLPVLELEKPVGIRPAQALQLHSKTTNPALQNSGGQGSSLLNSCQSSRTTSPVSFTPAGAHVILNTELNRSRLGRVIPEPTPYLRTSRLTASGLFLRRVLSSRRTSSPEAVPRKSRLLQLLPLNYDVTSFQTARNNSRTFADQSQHLVGRPDS